MLDTKDFEVRFARTAGLCDSFMIFGGNNDQHENSFTHAILSGLPISHAREISQSYPDFHMCKSPGAKRAQRLTETLSMIGANGRAKRALIDVVSEHGKRVSSGGERTCVRMSGSGLELDSVRLKANGDDVTRDIARLHSRSRFYLADEVRLVDCQSLLR